MADSRKAVLFVCLGNICRSPIAEAVMNHILKEKALQDKWIVDSAATGDWHVGCQPDKRARKCMEDHGVEMNHRARLLISEDFTTFDFIFGMDDNNIRDIEEIAPRRNRKAKVELLGSYDPQNQKIIRDPYYDSGSQGFEEVYQQCLRCCNAFLDTVT